MTDCQRIELNEHIGRRIQAARNWRQLTIEGLADAASVSLPRLRRIETGAEAADVVEIERIAKALGLPISQFIGACRLCGGMSVAVSSGGIDSIESDDS